jgi:hypothetical protein
MWWAFQNARMGQRDQRCNRFCQNSQFIKKEASKINKTPGEVKNLISWIILYFKGSQMVGKPQLILLRQNF